MAEKPEEKPTLSEDVVAKYKRAGEIANGVLHNVVVECVDGALVVDLCKMGDQLILDKTKKEYKKIEETKKGIAFHTCVSINNCVPINNCVCDTSTPRSDMPGTKLKNGDLVKVELGVHLDGLIAAVGHTLVVGSSKDAKVTGRQADVMQAAYFASEIAHRMLQPDEENMEVTDAIQNVANAFNCNPMEGRISSRLKKNGYDFEKVIILNPSEQQRREKTCKFELHEAYVVDILISTGEGKTHRLRPDVLHERDGEFVAQFKFTVLLMPNGPQRITSGPFDQDVINSSLTLEDPELQDILDSSIPCKNKKKKKAHIALHKNKKGRKANLARHTVCHNLRKGMKHQSAGSGKLTEDDLSMEGLETDDRFR